MRSRAIRPLRPANCKVDGTGYGTVDMRGVNPIPVSWARRNRLTETTPLAWGDPDVATVEAGTTTTLRLLGLDFSVIHEYTGLTGTTHDVDPADFGGEPAGYIEFDSERDGYNAWQPFRVGVLLSTSIIAEPGSYSFTGAAATLRSARMVVASAGSYAFTGSDATIHQSASRISAGAGSYAFTGAAATLKHGWKVSAGAGSYAFTGTAATLTNTTNDPNFSNVVLLIGANGTNGSTSFVDESASAKTITAFGNAQISTAQSKFGGSSAYFDGSADYLRLADSADWFFGTGQFTIELFVRFDTGFGSDETFVNQWSGTDPNQNAWFFYRQGGNLRFLGNNSFMDVHSSAWSATTGVWYHVAVDRDASNKIRLYIDGTMVGSTTDGASIRNSTEFVAIGTIGTLTTFNPLNGWIDELRITKGVARYASDSGYSVPTRAFPRS